MKLGGGKEVGESHCPHATPTLQVGCVAALLCSAALFWRAQHSPIVPHPSPCPAHPKATADVQYTRLFISRGVRLEDAAMRKLGKRPGQAGQLAGSHEARKALAPRLWGETTQATPLPLAIFSCWNRAPWQSGNTVGLGEGTRPSQVFFLICKEKLLRVEKKACYPSTQEPEAGGLLQVPYNSTPHQNTFKYSCTLTLTTHIQT